MNREEIEKKLRELDIEDFIWVIYIGIILLSWYSNYLERKYFLYDDQISREKYQKILIFIFSILVVVYFYFLNGSIKDLTNLKPSDTPKKKNLVTLSFIGSLLIAISGLIFLYIAIMDESIEVELAFN